MKKADRQKVFKKFDGHCAYCGEEIQYNEMQVDHVIPQSNFFSYVKNKWKVPSFLTHLTEWDCNHKDNLFPTCRKCNNWKTSFDLELFRDELSMQVKRVNKVSAGYRMAKRYGQIIETPKPIVFYFETLKQEDKK